MKNNLTQNGGLLFQHKGKKKNNASAVIQDLRLGSPFHPFILSPFHPLYNIIYRKLQKRNLIKKHPQFTLFSLEKIKTMQNASKTGVLNRAKKR